MLYSSKHRRWISRPSKPSTSLGLFDFSFSLKRSSSDNLMSDVFGAKLFDRYLRHGGRGRFDQVDLDLFEESDPPEVRTRHVVDRCISILVETGVYQGIVHLWLVKGKKPSEGCRINGAVKPISMLIDENLSQGEQAALIQPDFVERDLYAAIRTILTRENSRAWSEDRLLSETSKALRIRNLFPIRNSTIRWIFIPIESLLYVYKMFLSSNIYQYLSLRGSLVNKNYNFWATT